MKTIREGFTYEAENFENKDQLGQIIKFVEKERDGDMSFLIQDGTTLEELAEIMIARLDFMNDSQPGVENFHMSYHLKSFIHWMGERQRSKNKRLKAKGITRVKTII